MFSDQSVFLKNFNKGMFNYYNLLNKCFINFI